VALALLFDAQDALSVFFSEFGYLAPFTILVLCGFGLPIPEEVTMLGSGFLLYQERVEAIPIIVVCFVATLIGDSIPYFLGRKFGRKALRVRSVRRALNPARIRALERRFRKGGLKTVFACRFIPGLRLPAWFTAGTLGMPYHRFLAMDGLGAAIMTPFFVLLGRASGEKIAELETSVENLTQILGFVVVSVAALVAIHFLVTRWMPSSWKTNPAGQTGPGATLGGTCEPQMERRAFDRSPLNSSETASDPPSTPPREPSDRADNKIKIEDPETEDGDRP
jgi:membrane protein DedA with SNARE-associated domain